MTIQELKERQGWTLEQKIDHSLGTIDQFISRLNGQVYVGFSGGKDSTVLLDLCRIIKPNIKAVFCNTGNEYPDIVRFVRELKNTEGYNIDIIYPKLKPKEVFEKYGFPLISKETSDVLWRIKHRPNTLHARRGLGLMKGQTKYNGIVAEKWLWLKDEDFDVHCKCCDKLKKEPFHKYEKDNNLYPILGVMASESSLRQTSYIRQGGCNTFGENGGKIKSLPLSIWLEKDIYEYIERYNLKIADIYNKGAKRTGCMFCMYGAHFKDDNRLELCYKLYPKFYKMFMSYTNNGIEYREACRKVFAVCKKTLPDENKQLIFDF